MASIEIPSGVKVLSATTVDDLGKFDAIDETAAVTLALSSIPLALRYIGRKVLCNNVEYTFVEGTADINFTKTEYNVSPIVNGFKNAIGGEEYNEDFVGVNVSTNQTNYKSLRYRRGSRIAPAFANPFLYHALTFTPFVESCTNGRIFENSVDLKKGVHVGNIQVYSSIQRTTNSLLTVGGERGTADYVAQYEAYSTSIGTENIGFRSKITQPLTTTISAVARDGSLSRATITVPIGHGYSGGDCAIISEPLLGFPKVSVNSISWQRVSNVVTLNVASHTFLVNDTVTVATLNITGLITAITSTSITFINHGTDVALTNAIYSISHRTSVVILSTTATTLTFTNAGSTFTTTATTGTVTAPTNWNHRSSGSAPNAFAGKTYFGTANALDRTSTSTSVELRAGLNQLGYAAADAHPSYFGRNGHFGNTILTTPTVTVADINVISEGAMVFGNTTTGTPIDGTLSKITNGDANYFSNGTWRGLLHVLGGSGANTNIVTNTANALMKFVGTGLQAISSLITDNGTFLKYNSKTVQSTQTLSTIIGNSGATKTLGHKFTIPANLTEVGSCIEFKAVFLKNVGTAVTMELAVISNSTLDANNGTSVLTYLEAGGGGTLDNGDSYILDAVIVRDTLTSVKISAKLIGGGSANADSVTETRYLNFTANSANVMDIGVRMTGSATNDVINQFSTLKF